MLPPHALPSLLTSSFPLPLFLQLDENPIVFSIVDLIINLADLSSCRERLSDIGVIPPLVKFVSGECAVSGELGREMVEMCITALYNLSRSNAVHCALRDAGLFEAMVAALHGPDEGTTAEVSVIVFWH